jgi:hypothetical protein
VNLYEASNQWASRPPDERFWTISEAHQAALVSMDRSEEIDRTSGTLHMGVDPKIPGEVFLVGPSGNPAKLTHAGFSRLCSYVTAPASYLRTLPETHAAACLEHGLTKLNSGTSAKLLLHRDSTNHPVLRDITSEKYSRIWTYEVTERLRRLEDEQGWKLPPARPAHIGDPRARPATESDVVRCSHAGLGIKVGSTIAPAGAYVSDHDGFFFLVDDTRPIRDARGSVLFRGFFVDTQEIGGRSLRITMFLFASVCGNHIVWDVAESREIRIRHIGKAGDKTWAELAGTISRYAESSAAGDEAAIRGFQTRLIADTREALIDKLFGLDIAPRKVLGEGFERAKNSDHVYGDPRSIWGFVNGLTEVARDLQYADERSELDRSAAKILKMEF